MPFGQTPAMGATGSVFGSAAPAAPQPLHPQLGYATDATGSRVVPFQPPMQDAPGQGGARQLFKSVCAMPQYLNKSQDELRFEDYFAGVRGQAGAQPHGKSTHDCTKLS